MPELQFKGKEFVFNHHLTVPYRPIVPNQKQSIGSGDLTENLLINGDNLHALKALLPIYAGKIDCIYIDPPYNTKNETWRYNDNVNSPLIKEWIASNPVNGEDMLRHDKWLCLMYPRMKLLHELLSDQGVIFMSIDDNELYNLKQICEEIFGEKNWVGTIVWKNVTDNNPTNISIEHEYIVCFAKDKDQIKKVWKSKLSDVKDKLIEIGIELNKKHKDAAALQSAYTEWFRENKQHLWPLDRYKYIDKGGVYTGSQSVHNPGREGYRYDVLHDVTGKPCQEPLMGYRFPKETMDRLLADKKILFGDDHNKIIELKVYAHEYEEKLPSVIQLDGRVGAYELRDLFPDVKKVFDNPKPTALLTQILAFTNDKNSIVLDSFAGSGTTAHAVLAMNKKDGGNRKFILVESQEYADDLTRERIARVIAGVPKSKDETIKAGLGGAFTYCSLGESIDIDKILTGESLPDYKSIGAWLYHTATGEALKPKLVDEKNMFLGESSGYYVWLIYKPELEFLKSRTSALTLDFAEKIAKKTDKRHLVFAPAKYVPNKLLFPLGVEYAPLPFALYRLEK
jgi:adenine-specific DNA-methyltransferase